MSNITETMNKLKAMGVPAAYSKFKSRQTPPYVVYSGNGQSVFPADNTYTFRENDYQIEFYFTKKDETLEDRIEQLLLEDGFLYSKSEDVFIADEGVFVIYYQV